MQSVALRLICEREAGIEAFVPRQCWTVAAEAAAKDGGSFAATLVRLDGTDVGESGLPTERSVKEADGRIREARFRAVAVERDTLHRPPNPPFATANLGIAAGARCVAHVDVRSVLSGTSVSRRGWRRVETGVRQAEAVTHCVTETQRGVWLRRPVQLIDKPGSRERLAVDEGRGCFDAVEMVWKKGIRFG